MLGSYSKIAGGNVTPARFVKLDSTVGRVVECGAGEDMFGISQPSTRRLALSGWDDGFAAVAGENLNIIGPGDDEALLELGGTVTHGQNIKSGAAGVGVAATTDKDKVGAIALQSGVSGELIRVKPWKYDLAA